MGKGRTNRALCPVLVGRDAELAALREAVDHARVGRGGAVAVVGEPGVGKTRLARELLSVAAGRRVLTLVGRAVEHGATPYRPLAEALLPLARDGRVPDDPLLRPYRPALGVIVPDWGRGATAEVNPMILAEGVLRVGRAVSGAEGTLLVLEDLHWADPDTVSAVEYLADHAATERLLVVVTHRQGHPGPAADLLANLEARGVLDVHHLGRLSAEEVATMVASCLGGVPDPDALQAVARRSEGVPLLVEELLAVPASGVDRAVPETFAGTVTRRLATLPAPSVLVLQCAAVLGHHFDWRLLPAITGLDADEVRAGLERGVSLQLLAAGDGFHFRHALTCDAIVAAMLPPTLSALARRAAAALAASGDDHEQAALAAELWLAAGDDDAAARHLLAAGRRACTGGALATAERLLRRAATVTTSDTALVADVAEALVETHAAAANLEAALAAGARALAQLEQIGATADRRARLHLVLARAADAATRWELAGEHLDRAGRLADQVGDPGLRAAVDALAAHVAMGDLRYVDADRLARRAAAAASELDLPEVRCEALEVLGRRARLRDLDEAESLFAEAYEVALGHGLTLWGLRALHELGTVDMFRSSSPDRLLDAGERAYAAGALSLAATVDLQLLGLYAFLFQLDHAVAVGTRGLEVARTMGLRDIHAAALLQLAHVHALARRRLDVEVAVDEALQVAGGNPEVVSLAHGHARGMYLLMVEDGEGARRELDLGVAWAKRAPAVPGMFPAMWALLRALDGDDEAPADPVVRANGVVPVHGAMRDLALAVVDGRNGATEKAAVRAAEAEAVLRASKLLASLHLARRHLAEAAMVDGWGDPSQWLTEALHFFDDRGCVELAAACRTLLRGTGQRVPRTGAGAGMPDGLRRIGVTAREAEVLQLLGERLSNAEVAARLHLSTRTVEKHVERLLRKTGARDRRALVAVSRQQLGAPPGGGAVAAGGRA